VFFKRWRKRNENDKLNFFLSSKKKEKKLRERGRNLNEGTRCFLVVDSLDTADHLLTHSLHIKKKEKYVLEL
jgi:hypothetical protein